MLDFIGENLSTIVIAGIVLAVVIMIIMRLVRQRKQGCSGNCEACGGGCHSRKKDASGNKHA